VLPIGPAEAALSVRLDLPHADPFDGVIVATAQVREIALITADRAITEARPRGDDLVGQLDKRRIVR
jgi:PIN domain nuclease of toxin-antitoxin system